MDLQLDPRRNLLLAALAAAEWQRLQPLLDWVEMPLGQVLYEPGISATHVVFPVTAIAALLYLMEDGHTTAVAVVGDTASWASRSSWAGRPRPAAASCSARGARCACRRR